MSLEMFFKQNAMEKENKKILVSTRFTDDEGKPAKFEIKAITATEDQTLREACTSLKEIPGKKGQFAPMLNAGKYMSMLCAACVVYPELDNAALQDSYGVKTPADLLGEMLLPAEKTDLTVCAQNLCGYELSMNAEIETAKN